MSPWQFTIFRLAAGIWLLACLGDPSLKMGWLALFPGAPLGRGVLGALALALALGIARRPAAGLLAAAWVSGVLPGSLSAGPVAGAPVLILLLALLAPVGEPWSRRAAPADGAGWRSPPWLFSGAWMGLVTLDGWQAIRLMAAPAAAPFIPGLAACQLLLVLLLLAPRTRPWAWLGLLLGGPALLAGSWRDAAGLLVLQLFTFDPRWLAPVGGRKGRLLLAFDGDCMICSRTLRFLAAEDRADLLRFVTLQSALGREMEAAAGSGELQTMLVKADGRIFARSAGVLRVLMALGGHWRALGWAGRLVPRPLADALYGFIAAHRYRWFGKTDVCAMPSPELRARLVAGDQAAQPE